MTAVALAAGLLVAAAAVSVSNTYGPHDTPAFRACMDREFSDLGMRTCVREETERWDARLNAAYGTLVARLAPAEREALRRRERAWLRDRDRRCAHAGDDEAGGTLQTLEIAECGMARTQARAAALEAQLSLRPSSAVGVGGRITTAEPARVDRLRRDR